MTEVTEIKGKANLVLIRGKRKLGYELSMKVKVGGVGSNIDESGVVGIQISDDGDREVIHDY